MRGDSERLLPYVPRLVVDWLRDTPGAAHRRVDGTLAFCDVSGFTALTERLATRGPAGAEEMGEILNAVFTDLMDAAYAQGASLLKYGGDAVLLLFRGAGHEVRAARAAWQMQRRLDRIGRLRTSAGPTVLRLSIGAHTGPLDVFMAGSRHRELIVTGPAATRTAELEAAAAPGEVLLSAELARVLSPACVGDPRDGGAVPLAAPPGVAPFDTFPIGQLPDLSLAIPAELRVHLCAPDAEPEHRRAVPAFVEFRGADALLRDRGPESVAAALTTLVDAAVEAAGRHGVTFLASDLGKDGGKLLLAGGVPSQVDDAEGRVLCCLGDVLGSDSPFALRAGVSSGRVFAGDYGPPYRRTYSVIGDEVNLAARLMAAAAPGTLVATPEVVRRSRTPVVAAPLPPLRVKGKANPVEAVEVCPAPDPGGGPAAAVPAGALLLQGRRDELLALSRALAGGGQTSVTLRLRGGAGMGKTALLRAAVAQHDCVPVVVEMDAGLAALPFGALRRIVAAALEMRRDELDGDRVLGWLGARAPKALTWAPLLASLLGVEVHETPEVRDLDERFRLARLADTVGIVLAEASRPVVVDGVELLDAGSGAVLQQLAEQSDRLWPLVVAGREGPLVEGADLELAPLPARAVRELVCRECPGIDLPVHELDAIAERSGGNPLFARELVRLRATGSSADDLPPDVESVVAQKADRLRPTARRLLRTAAVVGAPASPADLERLAGVRGEPADWAALEEHLEPASGGRLRFRSALVRDVAYSGLPFRRRRALHARLAAELVAATHVEAPDDEQLALLVAHHERAGHARGTRDWAHRAAERALERYANHAAARYLETAVAAGRRLRPLDRAELSATALRASRLWYRLGDLTRAAANLHLARTYADEHRARLAASMDAVDLHLRSGRYRRALTTVAVGRRLAACLPGGERAAVLAELSTDAGWARLVQGREAAAVELCREAVAHAREAGDEIALARAFQVLDMALARIGDPAAGTHAAEALRIYEASGNLTECAKMRNTLGMSAYFGGDYTTALDHYARAAELFDRAGDTFFASVTRGNIAEIHVEQGRLDEALPVTERSLEMARGAGSPSFVALWSAQLGRIDLRQGRSDEGLAHLRSAAATYREVGEAAQALVVDAQLALGLSLAGSAAEALALARVALEQLPKVEGAGEAEAPLHRARGYGLLQLGRPADAVRAFHASLTAARARTARRDVVLALVALLDHDVDAATAVRDAWREECVGLANRLGLHLDSYLPPPLPLSQPCPVEVSPIVGVPALELPAPAAPPDVELGPAEAPAMPVVLSKRSRSAPVA